MQRISGEQKVFDDVVLHVGCVLYVHRVKHVGVVVLNGEGEGVVDGLVAERNVFVSEDCTGTNAVESVWCLDEPCADQFALEDGFAEEQRRAVGHENEFFLSVGIVECRIYHPAMPGAVNQRYFAVVVVRLDGVVFFIA